MITATQTPNLKEVAMTRFIPAFYAILMFAVMACSDGITVSPWAEGRELVIDARSLVDTADYTKVVIGGCGPGLDNETCTTQIGADPTKGLKVDDGMQVSFVPDQAGLYIVTVASNGKYVTPAAIWANNTKVSLASVGFDGKGYPFRTCYRDEDEGCVGDSGIRPLSGEELCEELGGENCTPSESFTVAVTISAPQGAAPVNPAVKIDGDNVLGNQLYLSPGSDVTIEVAFEEGIQSRIVLVTPYASGTNRNLVSNCEIDEQYAFRSETPNTERPMEGCDRDSQAFCLEVKNDSTWVDCGEEMIFTTTPPPPPPPVDADNDGYDSTVDCDDDDPDVHPGATENPSNGIDDDCDGTVDEGGPNDPDNDNDGFPQSQDCNDSDPDVNPGETEVPNNGIDDNCNGQIDEQLSPLPAGYSYITVTYGTLPAPLICQQDGDGTQGSDSDFPHYWGIEVTPGTYASNGRRIDCNIGPPWVINYGTQAEYDAAPVVNFVLGEGSEQVTCNLFEYQFNVNNLNQPGGHPAFVPLGEDTDDNSVYDTNVRFTTITGTVGCQ